MANTTFNPSDKSAAGTLSGGNLTFAYSGSNGWVRAVDKQVSGKFYWEVTATIFLSSTSSIGFASPTSVLTSGFSSQLSPYSSGVARTGVVYVDGVSTGINIGTIVSGTVVCIAYDVTNRLVWYRLGAAGNWNANATYNPATGVGGVSTTPGVGIPAHPAVFVAQATEILTANFGDTAFVGAVPSGYTSGFPQSAQTVLLVHADGADGSTTFTDVTNRHILTPTAGVVVKAANPKFGTGSAEFSSSIHSIDVGAQNSSDFSFGAGQFTVEAWAYFLSTPSGTNIVIGNYLGSSNLGWDFGLNAGVLSFFYSTTGSDNPSVGAAYSPTLNTWIHLAVDRDAANVLRVYAGGVVIASATVSATFFVPIQNYKIGNDTNSGRSFPGRLDEIRVTKGLARYGGAFTPPTAPFEIETNALASQTLAEHWLTTSPQAQVTQVVAEHWASVTSGNLQAVVTQVMLEHWASVAVVVPAAGGPMVTMIH